RGRALPPAPGGQAPDPAAGDGRTLPGDGLPARGRVRRGVPRRRPELAAVNPPPALKPLRRPWLWLGLWGLALAAVLVGSLLPAPELPQLPHGADKLEHFGGYGLLAAFAVQLF